MDTNFSSEAKGKVAYGLAEAENAYQQMKQNKVKRLKKGQALIQSKIASPSVGIANNHGFSAGH